MKTEIRKAILGDEDGIAKVHVQSWQETYKGLVPQTYLEEMPSQLNERISNWKKSITNPERITFVAENHKGIIGFVLFGPARDPDRAGFIELGAIYLLASEKGKGIGFSLVSAGFNILKELGFKKAYCWVLEGNPTNKFYERTGARFSGKVKYDEIGGQQCKEFAYEWENF